MTRGPLVVAIDGPAGAGKSAAARLLAARLRLPYLDTGAMYRAVALACLRQGTPFPLDGGGEQRVAEIAHDVTIAFAEGPNGQRVLLGGEDITEGVRTPEVSRAASMVSAVPAVRREMVARQRELAARTGGVVEGRDIGTVVFPDAAVKVFLTATSEVRARRRFDELRGRGADVTWESVLAEQGERDARDATRADSPLRPAIGAIILDTSALTLSEVVDRLLALLDRALTA